VKIMHPEFPLDASQTAAAKPKPRYLLSKPHGQSVRSKSD